MIRPAVPAKTYISVIQRKKRAETNSRFWYSDISFMLLTRQVGAHSTSEWTLKGSVLCGVKRSNTLEVDLLPTEEYCCIPFSFHATLRDIETVHFRLTIYSADSGVEVERCLNGTGFGRTLLHLLQRELVQQALRLVYQVAHQGALLCVHGEGCLYFLGLNGASDHYLSLRLKLQLPDGIIILHGKGDGEHDIPPQGQRILVIISTSGRTSAATQMSFRYMSSFVTVNSQKQHVCINSTSLKLGNALPLSFAGDLLASTLPEDQVRLTGGDTIDTYLWIPQVGASTIYT